MTRLDEKKETEAKIAEAKKAREQPRQELRQALTSAANGEHLTDDFEPVAEEQAGRTFTAEEVKQIISEERAKYAEQTAAMVEKLSGIEQSLTEREQALQAETIKFSATKRLTELGIDPNGPAFDLIIAGTWEETCVKIDTLIEVLPDGSDRAQAAMGGQHIEQRTKKQPGTDILRQVMNRERPKF